MRKAESHHLRSSRVMQKYWREVSRMLLEVWAWDSVLIQDGGALSVEWVRVVRVRVCTGYGITGRVCGCSVHKEIESKTHSGCFLFLMKLKWPKNKRVFDQRRNVSLKTDKKYVKYVFSVIMKRPHPKNWQRCRGPHNSLIDQEEIKGLIFSCLDLSVGSDSCSRTGYVRHVLKGRFLFPKSK